MLETILQKYFGLKKDYDSGTRKERELRWYYSYEQLVRLLQDLNKMGVLNSSDILDKLDKIDSLGF